MNFTCKDNGRADKIMSEELELSRSQIEKFIKSIGIKVNGKNIN
jgi:RNA-binding protein YlmH